MNKDKNISEIDLLTLWYEKYSNIIRFIGTISVSIIFFTSSFFLEDLVEGKFGIKITKVGITVIEESFPFFLLSLLGTFLCLIFTYNWYRDGISYFMKNRKDIKIPDDFWYDKAWISMKKSGILSWIFGGISGISLAVGVIIYVVNIYKFIELI